MQNQLPSFIAPPSNIAGSANQVGTVTLTDALGNIIKVERVVINSATGDVIAPVDAVGGLGVNLQQDSFSASESTQMRRLLELILLELMTFNSNFLNTGLVTTAVNEQETVVGRQQ